jgi:type I restriction enzyme S subunit
VSSLREAVLPAEWKWAPISENYNVTKKPRQLSYSNYSTIPFVPMDAVPADGHDRVSVEWRSPNAIASGTYFESGDVLLSKITPSFENGKQGLAEDFPADFGVASTEIIPLQASSNRASNRFLFYCLLHPDVRAALAAGMEGSTGRQRVPERAVMQFLLPMPPKPEQEKIAAVLEKVQRGVSLEEKLIATARELKQLTLNRLFTHGLRLKPQKETEIGLIPQNWKVTPIRGEARLVAGGTPSRSEPRYWNGGTIPWVKTGEIDYRVIAESEELITTSGLNESAAKVLPAGTILVAMYGQGKTRGKVAILGIEAATNQACVGIIPTSGNLLPSFLYHYLTYSYDRLRSLSHGAQQQNLNAEMIGSFCMPLPDCEEQREIADLCEGVDKKTSFHQRKRAGMKTLFNTLLNELMTGRIRVADLDIDVSDVTAA